MMKTLTLKATDDFEQKLIATAKELNLSKSELIRLAVEQFCAKNSEARVMNQVQEASFKTRYKLESADWEDTLLDGLEGQ
ncbi:MAG: hypothetical protein P8J70_06645 [Glaciecola sp.]|nr:hypothetical protein [Glaciecola sp.]MDG1816706.1 hypothetical protein [Glaciecola sp.]MDG2099339.1 hypothetical protein [Glaciecola sp.]